jgi:Uma2 family endonuclease
MTQEGPVWGGADLPEAGTVMSTLEYLATPETNRVHELWHGVLQVAESPTSWHQDLVFELAVALREHVLAHDLGKVWVAPLDVVLDHERGLIVQPDLMFVARGREDIVTNKMFGAPDLVVEVLSPHPRIGAVSPRVQWFAAHGVRECWLVHQLVHSIEILEFDRGHVARRTRVAAASPIPSVVLPAFPRTLEGIVGGWA